MSSQVPINLCQIMWYTYLLDLEKKKTLWENAELGVIAVCSEELAEHTRFSKQNVVKLAFLKKKKPNLP